MARPGLCVSAGCSSSPASARTLPETPALHLTILPLVLQKASARMSRRFCERCAESWKNNAHLKAGAMTDNVEHVPLLSGTSGVCWVHAHTERVHAEQAVELVCSGKCSLSPHVLTCTTTASGTLQLFSDVLQYCGLGSCYF
eukprot:734344-Amphidinium_carterae.3